MHPEFQRMIIERDEAAMERAYYGNELPHVVNIDWHEDDAEVVALCAGCLQLDSLKAEPHDDGMDVEFEGRKFKVPLQFDEGDRHVTLCALNQILESRYQLRFVVISHGSDTMGVASLSVADWAALEQSAAESVAENFIDPRKLPNVYTELTDAKLPVAARARHARMLERNRSE